MMELPLGVPAAWLAPADIPYGLVWHIPDFDRIAAAVVAAVPLIEKQHLPKLYGNLLASAAASKAAVAGIAEHVAATCAAPLV